MLNFKLWLEAFLEPTEIQKIKEKLETEGYATVYIDGNGNIKGEYPTPLGYSIRRFGRVGIVSRDKQVSIDGAIGARIKPAVQKLLKALLSADLIRADWEIAGKAGERVSEYIGWKYTHFKNDLQKHNIGSLINQEPFSRATRNLVLYHGTSETDWEQIKKTGYILPLFVGSNQKYGYESRVKHKGNKDLLYLATSEGKAWDFAKTRARDRNREVHPNSWEFDQYHGPNQWKIKPVLLRVHVPDMTKLRADDDIVNSLLKRIGRRLWSKMSRKEKDEIIKKTSDKAGYDTSSMADYYWWESDDGFSQLLDLLPPKVYDTWIASINRYNQVAYKGRIPTTHVEEIPILSKSSE